MTWQEIEAAIRAIRAAAGDLTIDQLEELACLASEIRSEAWTIRAQKIQADLQA
jgi:hypothetical protein